MRKKSERVKRRWSLTLAFTIGLEAFVPLGHAAEPRAPDAALRESFARVKAFARAAEAPVAAAPITPEPAAPSVPAPAVPAPDAPEPEAIVAAPTADRLDQTTSLMMKFDRSKRMHHALRNRESALRAEIAEILHAVHPDDAAVTLEFHDSLFPAAHFEVTREGDQYLSLTTGLFAMVDNRDELAGVIAQAIARTNPRVFGHLDDPRITRRLDEQMAFEKLSPSQKTRVQADLSAIERLRACDLRPWGLTDYELRTFGFFRDEFDQRPAYFTARALWRQDRLANFYTDNLFEIRVLAQKVAITYMQERENIRDLVRTTHEFGPELTALRAQLRREFKNYLRPWGVEKSLALYTGLASLLVVPAVVPFAEMQRHAHDLVAYVGRFIGGDVDAIAATLEPAARLVEVAYELLRTTVSRAGEIGWRVVTTIFAGFEYVGVFLKDAIVTGFTYLSAALTWVSKTFWTTLSPALGENHWTWTITSINASYMLARRRGGIKAVARNTVLAAREFESWSMAHVKQFIHGGVITRLLAKDPGTAAQVRRFVDVAHELNALYHAVIVPPFAIAIGFNPYTLRELRDVYSRPDEFWSFLKQFLDAVRDEVAAGRLDAETLREIFAALEPGDIPVQMREDRFKTAHAEPFLVLELLQWRGYRRRLADLYRVIDAKLPGIRHPLTPADLERPRWVDFDETQVRSPFLGLARLAVEADRLAAAPEPGRLGLLHGLIFARLGSLKFAIDLHRTQYASATRAAFDGELSTADAKSYRVQLEDARAWNLRRDARMKHRDAWPAAGEMFSWQSAAALATGRLGRAVAIETWRASAPSDPALIQLVSMIVGTLGLAPAAFITKSIDLALSARLARFGTLRELSAWIDAEVLSRGANENILTPRLYRYVVDHPQLITDAADVADLLKHEYYWPRSALVGGPFQRFFNTFSASLRGHQPLDDSLNQALRTRAQKSPRVWTYEHTLAERLHQTIVKRLTQLGQMPTDYAGLKQFWIDLSERGVTAETDRLVQILIERAPPEDLDSLRRLAIEEGRVWETELHSRLSIARAESRPAFRRLRASDVGHPRRLQLIDHVIASLGKTIPERGLSYAQFLENLSVSINSSYPEAKRISQAKGDVSSVTGADSSVQTLRDIFRGMDRWPREDKFNFVLVLRGEAAPRPRVLAAFPKVGLERVRRMYEVMPLAGRTGALDTFFTHALLGPDREGQKWGKIMSRHIVGGQKTEAQRVTLQVLTAFLSAMAKVGNVQMTTTILSYLYALPSTAVASPVEVLKLVLEIFGATGIKVGQFIYASQLLGHEGHVLRALQSRARVPDRIEMYEDLYDLLGVPVGTPLPFVMLELLGAASMKYAFMAEDQTNLQKLVFKVFRIDAMNNVEQQFDVLEHMGDHLIKHHGARYGVLKIIIKTARLAVKREGSMRNENRRSAIARGSLYADRSTADVTVAAPYEELLNERLILAEFAAGTGFDELPDEVKPGFARVMLEMEDDILFAATDVQRFDPDRHAGNSRLETPADALRPIDFGQLIRMRRAQRERITKLFALAQIAGAGGVNAWVRREIGDLLDLDDGQRARLKRNLSAYVKSAQDRPVTRYIATLAALEASGFEITDTTYVDFVRAIIQLTPFEPYAPDARAPRKSFQTAVVGEIQTYLQRFEFDAHQEALVKVVNWTRRVRGALTGREIPLIPTDLSRVSFEDLIQTERRAECELALGRVD